MDRPFLSRMDNVMASTQTLKVPVRLKDDSIMHDTDYQRGVDSRDEAADINAELDARDGDHRFGVTYVMEEVRPFYASLRLVEIYRSGSGSAVYAYFEDVSDGAGGARYPMFLTDLADFLGSANMTDGVAEHAQFEACKRGKAYGIRKVQDGDAAA